MKKFLSKTILVLLISNLYFLVSGLRPAPSLAQGNSSCDEAGESCCPSRTGGACKIGTGLVCVAGTCKNPNELPPPETCDQDGDLCCVDSSSTKFCLNGLQCQSNNTCQRLIDRSIRDFGSPGGLDNVNPLCGTGDKGVNTAIGCLMAGDPKQFISQLLGWGVGVGGGIAFLLIVYAGFQMATAGGDPKRVQAAKELLTSALAGLILIVLSVVLLNFIGVKILNLPGFAGNPDLNL